MPTLLIQLVWFALTIILYLVVKQFYLRYHKWWLMPMISVPAILITCIIVFRFHFEHYIELSRWLIWLLGPATISFAVPIYEKRKIIYQHWLIMSIGVLTGIVVSVSSSILLAKLFHLSGEVQASLATRSISTPFAMMIAPKIGGSQELAAVFVILTGVFGMTVGQLMLALLPVKTHLAKGSLFGAASHVCGTTKAMEMGLDIGVVSSLVTMLSGIATVFLYPVIVYVLNLL